MNALFDNTKIKVLNKNAYEECNVKCEHTNEVHKYRQIFNCDDYDYVEDELIIKALDEQDYI